MKQKSKKTGILGIVLIVVMVLLVIGMDVLCLAYQNMINLFFREEVKTDIAAVEARAQEITADINAEGTVLLKNDGNVLPISEKVNLLGACSYQQLYLGTGSAGGWNWSADTCVNLKDALASEGITVNPDLWQFYIDNYTANDGQTGGVTKATTSWSSLWRNTAIFWKAPNSILTPRFWCLVGPAVKAPMQSWIWQMLLAAMPERAIWSCRMWSWLWWTTPKKTSRMLSS